MDHMAQEGPDSMRLRTASGSLLIHCQPAKGKGKLGTRPLDMDITDRGGALTGSVGGQLGSIAPHRIKLPQLTEDFVERESLALQLNLTQRRTTVLSAPFGFGKTTLLADACRRFRERGHVVAWLSIEENDNPTILIGSIESAFVDAGLKLLDIRNDGGADALLQRLLHSIEKHGGPCVLALDDVDRLQIEESLALLDQMLKKGPANLHLGMTCRERPRQLEIAPWVLEGRGTLITVEELRFGRPEVERFFNGQLPSKSIEDHLNASEGWPIALQLTRNRAQHRRAPRPMREVTENWLVTQLFRGLPTAEREFAQEVCLVEWIDADLLDGVLGPGSMKRLVGIQMLAGLLGPVGKGRVLRIHAVVRNACSARLQRERPDRFREVHRRIAEALAGRGQVADAMRHAKSADEPELVARILEDAGGIRLWLRFGIGLLERADRLMMAKTLDGHPRLSLARCALLAANGQFEKAHHLYDRTVLGVTDQVRGAAADREFVLDELVLRGMFFLYRCESVSAHGVLELMAEFRELADDADLDRLLRGLLRYGIAVFEHQRAKQEDAKIWIGKALEDLDQSSEYLSFYARLQEGALALASGRSDDAAAAYQRGFDVYKREFAADSGALAAWNALAGELNLERNETTSLAGWSIELENLAERGAWLDVFVAAATVSSELAMARGDVASAVATLRKGVLFAWNTRRPALRRALAAQYSCALVRAGRVDDARRIWHRAGLPTSVEECARLGSQTWREMECLCRARVWLLLAEGNLAAARELADAFAARTRDAGLRRSLGWALALSAVVESQADVPDRAFAHLREFESIRAETGYCYALICLAEYVRPLLETHGDKAPELAAELTSVLDSASIPSGRETAPNLTSRERQVLQRLDSARDKEIAAVLGISVAGVRHHVNNIFRKLSVGDRRAAVRRAWELGVAARPALESPPPPGARGTSTGPSRSDLSTNAFGDVAISGDSV